MRAVFDWVDERTDYRRLLAPIRRRVLPNGPKWSYSTASCLLWLFVTQLVTGLLLMLSYSPSITTAWASVHFIEQSPGGRFLRGLHHYTSHALIILCGVHVVRVLLARAFAKPRELLWATGLLLIPLFLVWAISGNPLAAGQRGISQIEVEGNIIGSTPVIGPLVQRILIGGDEVGHLTLTHLYFLHVGLLPLLVIGLLIVHISQVYRHGLMSFGEPESRVPYWPYQTIRNMTVLSIVLGTIAWISWRKGAPLDAPADPLLTHTPRPEWYFRSLFELRRYFTGDWEFVATMIIPASVLGFFVVYPILDNKLSARWSLTARVLVVLIGAGAWGGLTATSYVRDWNDAEYQASRQNVEQLAARSRELADRRPLPPGGPLSLLRDDAKTQGPLLFARHCASCHSHVDAAGQGIAAQTPSAPNLKGFGTVEWISGMLDPERIVSDHYFGKTKFAAGDMVSKVQELFEGLESEAVQALRADLRAVTLALAAEAALPGGQQDSLLAHADEIRRGRELLTEKLACTDCHRFHEQGDVGSAPDLTGYGSRDWLLGMIANPQQERFYSEDRNDRMPAFAEDTQHPDRNILTPHELSLIVDWLRGDWYESPRTEVPGDMQKHRSNVLATAERLPE